MAQNLAGARKRFKRSADFLEVSLVYLLYLGMLATYNKAQYHISGIALSFWV